MKTKKRNKNTKKSQKEYLVFIKVDGETLGSSWATKKAQQDFIKEIKKRMPGVQYCFTV